MMRSLLAIVVPWLLAVAAASQDPATIGADLARAETLLSLARTDRAAGRHAAALGRYDEAVAILETAAPRRRGEIHLERGRLLGVLGRYDEARSALDTALDLHREGSRAILEASTLHALANLAGSRAHYGRSIELLREALRVWGRLGDEHASRSAGVWRDLGGVYSEIGLEADAESALARALELDGTDASAHVMLGMIRVDFGRAAESLASFRRGIDLAAGREHVIAEAMQHRGRALLAMDRPHEAAEAFRRSYELRRTTGSPFRIALALTGWGDALARGRSWKPALARYEEAIGVAGDLGTPEATWRAHAGASRAAAALDRDDRAIEHAESAIEQVESIRAVLGAPALRLRYLGDKLDLYRRTALLLGRRGDDEASFRMANAAKSRTLLELTAYRPADRPVRLGITEELATEAAEAERELFAIEMALSFSGVGRAALGKRVEEARARHTRARHALALAAPREVALVGLAEAASLEDVRARVPEKAALLEWIVGEDGVAVWLVTREQAHLVELDVDAVELARLVDRIHRPLADLRCGSTDVANLRFDVRAALALHEALIAPLLSRLVDRDELLIVPDGVLRRLPFALLVSAHEKRRVDPSVPYAQYAGCRFLVEDHAISSLPCAGLLGTRRRTGATARPLVLGDPRIDRDEALPLAAARREARAVGARLGVGSDRVLLGAAATEAAFRAAAPSARVLHLATHGTLDDRRPAYSRLWLAAGDGHDGTLAAWEIEGLRVAADTVVLSGCETAGSVGRGEGLLGLARAFLQAGAGSVLASSWVVDDEATAELMRTFHRWREAGASDADALATAQRELIRARGRRLVHPFFWAAFSVFSGN